MKILLDTSFLRHLEQVNLLQLLSTFSENLGWEFVMPEIVHNELRARDVPQEIESFLESGTVNLDSCNQIQFLSVKYRLLGLDDGELEAICIVDKCEDRTFKNYLILTDDIPAQNGSGKLGMNSLDVLMFLFVSNERGFLSKNIAENALETLESSGYNIDGAVKVDYLQRLQ